jgi:rubredoxin
MAKAVVKAKKARSSATKSVRSKAKAQKIKKATALVVRRYKCRFCNYVYSPLRGEPHNGIPEGTEFDDLPDTYVCPVCGYQGKGKIGTWGFEEWKPTKYICSMCGYIYDEARGEPHHGIKPGTKFDDLPDDYRCPVCALDPKITKFFGKVLKQGFDAIDVV